MKKGIHPKYYPNAKVICACGNTFIVGSTKKVIRTDVCSACHPFFTGEQRIVDTTGQVDRFLKRIEEGDRLRAEREKRKRKPTPVEPVEEGEEEKKEEVEASPEAS